jgi:hypothetical protein
MTESDWATCTHPAAMLSFLRDRGASERKLRLFAVACCRRVLHMMADLRCRHAVEVAEAFADGSAGDGERGAAMREANQAALDALQVHLGSEFATSPRFVLAANAATSACGTPGEFATNAVRGILGACWKIARDPESALGGLDHERAAECITIRDIFGDPFKPTPFAPSWRTDTVVTLARQQYETRDFSLMPIMGDALQDAGCEEESILNHCRSPGVHVRGCFVVDLVLNRS